MRWRFLILAGALLAVYGAGLFLRFGFYDDYYALNWAVNGSDKLLLFCAAQGRPLDGLIADLAFKIPHTVDGLVWLRMTTLVGLGAFAWTIGKSLTRAGWPAAHALCVSIIVVTLPAAQVYAAWSIEIAKPWAGVLAGCAACLAARSLDLHRGEAALRTLSFAAALLFAAFTIYQPGAMIFFVFVAIDIFRPIAPASPWRRRLGTFASVAFVALAGEWILFRVASRWINPAQFPGASIVERARTISPAGLLHKLAFFVRAPLNESLRGPALPLPWQGSVAIGAMIGIGLLLYFPGRPMARLRYLAVAAALLPMTFACNLLTVEDAAAYRMQVAMECLVAVYALFAMQGWWRAASGELGRRTHAAGKRPAPIAMVPTVLPAALRQRAEPDPTARSLPDRAADRRRPGPAGRSPRHRE